MDSLDDIANQIRSCRNITQGRSIHAEILESEHRSSIYLRNLLIDMYGSCSSVTDARTVFNSIHFPNIYSWNIMIKAYVQNGFTEEALQLYTSMEQQNVKPNEYTFSTVLGACSDLTLGEEMRSKIVHYGLESHVVVATALINMYSRCGDVVGSRQIFDRMLNPNTVAWTSIITAYAQKGHLLEAKSLFDEMPEPKGVACNVIITSLSEHGELEIAKSLFDSLASPDVVCQTSMLVAYAQNGHTEAAREIFNKMPERTVVSWNAMISIYIQCGELQEARGLFDKSPCKDTVSWTCMITAYAQAGHVQEARLMFENVETRDVIVWNVMLGGYAQEGHILEAKEFFDRIPCKDTVSWNTMLAGYALHGHFPEAEALFSNMPQQDVISWNTMITSYAYNGRLQEASLMFESMPIKNVVSWNIMIVAFAENGRIMEAIKFVIKMDLEGYQTDKFTFIRIFNACTGLAAAEQGKVVHVSIVEAGYMFDHNLVDALVNMYAKCGNLEEARASFNDELCEDVGAWNVMIMAYSSAGRGAEAVELFRTMELQGLLPDHSSFVRLLSACNHAGMIEQARMYFTAIANDYELQHTFHHYLCMVDVLGRSGRLRQANELLEFMPYHPDLVGWTSLMSACIYHGDTDGGIDSARRVFNLQPETSTPYVLLSNIYKTYKESFQCRLTAKPLRPVLQVPRMYVSSSHRWVKSVFCC